ncbi:hypothetical protein HGG71_08025 [Rhodobacteraceae bacterium R_SAG2]|nr:hypothetical protein [Rhodobacteraceae bacterium R_SAG2]
MIAAFASYGLVCLASAHALLRRNWLELSVLVVPLVYCGYFIISIFIFSFGETMPFTYYSRSAFNAYSYVSTMICFHFLSVFTSLLLFKSIDRRKYEPTDLSRVRAFGVGVSGAAFCALPAFFVFIAVPMEELWDRPRYIFESDTAHWMRFADLLLFVSAVLTPFIRSALLKFLILFLVSTAFLSVGSRSGVAMIFIFAGLELFVIRRHNKIFSVAILLISLWMLGVVLYLRAINSGGIVQVIEVADEFDKILPMILFGTNYNINLSFVMIAELLATVEAEAQWFYYSVLPVPSAFYDRSVGFDAANRFRANMPYSGFGYALSYLGGLKYLGAVFLSSALFLLARKSISTRRDILEALLCFSFFSFPFLLLLQYNLRTGTRLIYGLAIFYFTIAVLRRIRVRGAV